MVKYKFKDYKYIIVNIEYSRKEIQYEKSAPYYHDINNGIFLHGYLPSKPHKYTQIESWCTICDTNARKCTCNCVNVILKLTEPKKWSGPDFVYEIGYRDGYVVNTINHTLHMDKPWKSPIKLPTPTAHYETYEKLPKELKNILLSQRIKHRDAAVRRRLVALIRGKEEENECT